MDSFWRILYNVVTDPVIITAAVIVGILSTGLHYILWDLVTRKEENEESEDGFGKRFDDKD